VREKERARKRERERERENEIPSSIAISSMSNNEKSRTNRVAKSICFMFVHPFSYVNRMTPSVRLLLISFVTVATFTLLTNVFAL